MRHLPKGLCSRRGWLDYGWLKPDTLALVIADIEEAVEANPGVKPNEIADRGEQNRVAWDAVTMLAALVGSERADEMIDKARER